VRNYLAIVEREVKSYFVSPIAYVVIALFLVISGIFFFLILSRFATISQIPPQYAFQYGIPAKLNVNMMAIRPLLHNMSLFALFWLPLVTMKLYAEEKKSGTFELLLTSPITNLQTLLAKFTAAVILFVTMLALTCIYLAFVFLYGNPELKPILAGYLGLFLIGAAYIAFGLFFSSLTENQIIAAVSAMAFILLFWAIGWVSDYVSPTVAKICSSISLIEHFDDFAKGVIDSKHLVFYLSFTVMGIFLTYVSVESARWRGTR